METIQKATEEYRRYLSLFGNPFLSAINRDSFFAAVLNLTVVSASGLPMVGPNEDGTFRPLSYMPLKYYLFTVDVSFRTTMAVL